MADITTIDGDETTVTQNKDVLSSAQMSGDFDSPVMWDNVEGGDDEDEDDDTDQSRAARLRDRLGKTPAGVPGDAFHIDDESECDGTVHEGPRGGLYCSPDDDGDGDGGSVEDQPELSDAPPDGADLSTTETETSLTDAGITNATWAQDMAIHDNDHRVFTRSLEGTREFQPEAAEEIRENILTGSIVTRTLGGNSPGHFYYEDRDAVAAEGIDGSTFNEVEPDDINTESFVDAYAAGLIAGNSDLHGGNFIVDPDGDVWLIDHDRAEQSLAGIADRKLDDFDETADELGLDASREDVEERMQEMAEDAPDFGDELPFDTAGRIQSNVETAVEGEFA